MKIPGLPELVITKDPRDDAGYDLDVIALIQCTTAKERMKLIALLSDSLVDRV